MTMAIIIIVFKCTSVQSKPATGLEAEQASIVVHQIQTQPNPVIQSRREKGGEKKKRGGPGFGSF